MSISFTKSFGSLLLAGLLAGQAHAGVEGGIGGGKGHTLGSLTLSKEVYSLALEGLKHHETVYVVVSNGDGLKVVAVKEEDGRIVDAADGSEIKALNRSLLSSLPQ